MNKYRKESSQSQRERRLNKMCRLKVRYPNEQAAYQKGQQTYHCPNCKGWHRSGSLATLVAKARRSK